MQTLSYDRSNAPTIKAFMESDAFIRAIMGPLGSGKSTACVWDIIQRGLKQKPGPDGIRRTRWCIIRNTFSQLNDTTIRTVHQWFPPITTGRWRATDHEFLINTLMAPGDKFPAQIELLFRALDRPDHVRKLLSLDLTGAWINEAREVPWPIIEALQGRVDRYPRKIDGGASWAGVILDTNPPDSDSKWFKFFEEEDHSDAVAMLAEHIPGMSLENYARIFKQPSGLGATAENTAFQSPGYWQRLSIGKTQEWIKVYCKGEYGFVVDGRPCFPEYHDNIHCPGIEDERRAPRTDPRLPIQRGWDFGLTPACVFSQLSARGQWKVVDELVSSSMGVDRFSDQVLSHAGQHFPDSEFVDVGDPAGDSRVETDEKTCFDILRSKGIMIEAGLQTPQIRFESVRKPLRLMDDDGYPAFNIHPRCTVTRRGLMGGYHFRKIQISGTERYAEKPEKNSFSHPCEAMGYTATRLFGPGLQYHGSIVDADEIELNSRLRTDQTRSHITGY